MSNIQNLDLVYNMIMKKKSYNPYYTSTTNVITDYDEFPYKRWYRGIATSSDPIVAEREAGWRPRRDNCYNPINTNEIVNKPSLCFESACSTIFRCVPKKEEKNYIDPTVENSNVISYR